MELWKILHLAPGGALALILTSLIIAPLTLPSVLAEGDVIGSNGATEDIAGTPQKNPILTAEGNNVYILWTGNLPNNTKTFFIRSEDGGLSFTYPMPLGDKALSSPSMSASRDNVYLVWDDPSQEPYDVYFRRSTDAGTTFGPPVNLSNNDGFSRNPRIASYGSNVYVAWFDSIPSSNRVELFLKASNDNGTNFSDNIKLSNSAVDSAIQITTLGNNVYVVWQDLNAEKYDIMFAVSNDSGKSFREFKVNEENSDLAFLGSIFAFDKDVYVAWYERIGEFGSHVLFRSSHDNGDSFGPVLTLSSDIRWDILTVDVPVTAASEIPKVVSSGDNVYVMWRDGYVNGTADLVLRKSEDKGSTFGDISRISGITGPYPQIDASRSNSYLMWENSNSTNSDVFLASIVGTGKIINVHNVSNDTGHSAFPQIIANEKEAFVVWTDYTDSSRFGEIFYAKSADGEVLGRLRITYDSLVADANGNGNFQPDLQSFALSTSLDNKNYTVFGKSQNITVTTFTIHPNSGISIQFTPQDKDGVMELALPKDIIEGMRYVDITIDDFSLARDFDELNGNSTHTTVNFVVPAGTRQIEIKGTQVVPEFDSLVMLTILASVIAVLITSQRLGIKRRW